MLGCYSAIDNMARGSIQPLLGNTLTEILRMLLLCLGTQQNSNRVYGKISKERKKDQICFYSLNSYFQNHKSQIMCGALNEEEKFWKFRLEFVAVS